MFKNLIVMCLSWAQLSYGFVNVWPLGLSVRMDRDENQNLITRSTQQLSAGVHFNQWSVEFGRTLFHSDSQEGNLYILREYEDFTLWLGHHLSLLNRIDFVGSGGFGLYQEKIKTVVGAVSDSSTSQQKALFGFAGELRWKPVDLGLLFSTGVRFMIAENFDPNPQPEFFIRAGWQF